MLTGSLTSPTDGHIVKTTQGASQAFTPTDRFNANPNLVLDPISLDNATTRFVDTDGVLGHGHTRDVSKVTFVGCGW